MRLKRFLFTGFFSGYSPFAPGTAGTAVGMLLYFIEYIVFGPNIHWGVNLAIVLILLYPSVRICDWGEIFFKEKDPGPVVWDEIIGYWVTMLFLPYSWKAAAAGFVLFRIMDVWKPFPIYQLQNLKGGLGILIDDVAAGIYSCVILHILVRFAGINL
ncbi:MAG: phosphatidylglycerophosphatase A [Spirochaetia bacterium]|jgi:phosphatidylglycerophosphatase A|nr:phosphatidylglycerophosphatase A [Spirochaetia bacterium]